MATKLGVSIATYVHRNLLATKPDDLGVSEWVEELIVAGLESKNASLGKDRIQSAATRNSAAAGSKKVSGPGLEHVTWQSALLGLQFGPTAY